MNPSPFASAAPTLIGNGYSPIPILPPDATTRGRGKAPGRYDLNKLGEPDWFLARGWDIYCERQAFPNMIAHWAKWPDASVGVACGYSGLIAVDIDDDRLIEPLLQIIPLSNVQKKGRKGVSLFYRSTEPLPSNNYRDGDKRGLLDFLSNGKQTVLPPSIHPDTGEPYVWLTPDTLLNTPINELPAFTAADHAAMEDVLRAHGWNAPRASLPRQRLERPVGAASDRIWVDDVNSTALANLSAWVPAAGFERLQEGNPGYRAIATWRSSGTGRSPEKRGANLSFHPSGIVDWGTGEKYTPIRVIAKLRGIPYPAAVAWLRECLGMPDERLILLNANRSPLSPTYPDSSVSLEDATAELRGALSNFESDMKAWRIYRNETRLKPALIHRQPPVGLIRIDTAGGKTHESTQWTREWRRLGWRPLYVTPRIDLADPAAKRIAAPDITARVYRGRDQDDPGTPGKKMCQNPDAVQAALDLGVNVRRAVCERDGVRCPFFEDCGYERQMLARPDVWVVTPNMLLRERPECFYEPDGLIFDEAFHEHSIGIAATIVSTELARAPLDNVFTEAEIEFLTTFRAHLQGVIIENGAGHLSRTVLELNGINIRSALKAASLEQRPVSSDVLEPRMNTLLREGAVKRRGAINRLLRNLGVLWEQIAVFLDSQNSHCGRIVVDDGSITVTPLLPIHPSWIAPAIVMDATMTTPEIIDTAVFGDRVAGTVSPVALKADIAIEWPDHVRVRQILGATISMSGLGVGQGAEPKPQNEAKMFRYIAKRAANAHPGRIGVICYKQFRERFEAKYPGFVDWMHFNAVSGLNDFEKVEGLIVIGRIWNNPATVETEANVFAGYPVRPEGEFYRQYIGGIRMTSGPAVPAFVDCHSDPFAEAVRWGRTEAGLLQALGRLRAPRRGEPCFLDIIGDVVLPVTVDEVFQWDDIKVNTEGDMMPYGVVLTNVSDAKRAFEITEHAARGVGELSNDMYSYRVHRLLPLRQFQYKKAGPSQKTYGGYALPELTGHGEDRIWEWLVKNVAPLAFLTVQRVRAKDSPYARSLLAKVWRESENRLSAAGLSACQSSDADD